MMIGTVAFANNIVHGNNETSIIESTVSEKAIDLNNVNDTNVNLKITNLDKSSVACTITYEICGDGIDMSGSITASSCGEALAMLQLIISLVEGTE